jgi:hypothetical protein
MTHRLIQMPLASVYRQKGPDSLVEMPEPHRKRVQMSRREKFHNVKRE